MSELFFPQKSKMAATFFFHCQNFKKLCFTNVVVYFVLKVVYAFFQIDYKKSKLQELRLFKEISISKCGYFIRFFSVLFKNLLIFSKKSTFDGKLYPYLRLCFLFYADCMFSSIVIGIQR